MSYQVEPLPGYVGTLAEGPHWDIEQQSLYYVDMGHGTIHRYSYDENKTYSAKIENDTNASFIIPVEGEKDRFAVGIGHRVGVIHWDGSSEKATVERIIFEVEMEDKFKDNHLNDGKADSTGRLVTGTVQKENHDAIPELRIGNLYSYSKDSNVTRIRSQIAVSNGLVWNEKIKKMYYIDSADLTVREFNYDFANGTIDEGRVLINFRTKDNNSSYGPVDSDGNLFGPDGMTIDSEGFLYVAIWGGSKVVKINPTDGKIAMTIDLPCDQVTSCAFGGPNLDILYVTTASFGDKLLPAGYILKITELGAKGLPMQKVKL